MNVYYKMLKIYFKKELVSTAYKKCIVCFQSRMLQDDANKTVKKALWTVKANKHFICRSARNVVFLHFFYLLFHLTKLRNSLHELQILTDSVFVFISIKMAE